MKVSILLQIIQIQKKNIFEEIQNSMTIFNKYSCIRSSVVKSQNSWDSIPNQNSFFPKIDRKKLNLVKMKQLFKIKMQETTTVNRRFDEWKRKKGSEDFKRNNKQNIHFKLTLSVNSIKPKKLMKKYTDLAYLTIRKQNMKQKSEHVDQFCNQGQNSEINWINQKDQNYRNTTCD